MAGIAGLGAALELLAEVGSAHIHAQVAFLVEQLSIGLARRGWQIAGPWQGDARAGILAFTGAGDMQKLFRYLAENGVVAALRDGRIRLSPHFANDTGDVTRFFAVLDGYGRTAA
jgi:selenocysteine lyase/cysteine desulfurase